VTEQSIAPSVAVVLLMAVLAINSAVAVAVAFMLWYTAVIMTVIIPSIQFDVWKGREGKGRKW